MEKVFYARAGSRVIGPFYSYEDAVLAALETLGELFAITLADDEESAPAAPLAA